MRLHLLAAAISLAVGCLPSAVLADDNDGSTLGGDAIADILGSVPLIDGHNDLVIHYIDFETGEFKPAESYDILKPTSGQTDLPRMRKGRLGAVIFTIWTPDDSAPEAGLEASIGLFHDLVRRSPNDLAIVTSPDELVAAHNSGKIGIMLGLEGGNPVEGDLDRLAWMRERGVAEMGLVWSTNGLGTAGREADKEEGLTELGRNVVQEMNRLGMIIDVSHASPVTVLDVVALSKAPVIDTHAYSSKFTSAGSSITDLAHKAVADHGGLVMPMFMPDATSIEYRAWIGVRNKAFDEIYTRLNPGQDSSAAYYIPWDEDVTREIDRWIAANPPPALAVDGIADVYDHIRGVVGIDHIGIGSDFDGMGFHPTNFHPAMKDVSHLPALILELKRRGWSDEDLRKLAGENFLRVWRQIIAIGEAR
jgi:membrane dipeptidase